MSRPALLAGALAALALSGCSDKPRPGPADAGPPPVATAAPVPGAPIDASAPDASAPDAAPAPPVVVCPSAMVLVNGAFCVDRWEASFVDRATKTPLSPYYPVDRKFAADLFAIWDRDRTTMGDDQAQATELPPLPVWQRAHDAEPMAVSRPNVVPAGYVSGVVAARACAAAGKRLCTYDEWLTACEGEGKTQFPYGDSYKQGTCNIFRSAHPAMVLHGNASIGMLDPRLNLVADDRGDPLLRKTGATPGCKSVWGKDAIWDMNGNLDEWVESEHGRFVGGFYSRSKKDGCKSSVSAHGSSYADYSTGARCCWSPP